MLEKAERILYENNLGIILSRPHDGGQEYIHVFNKDTLDTITFNTYNARIDSLLEYNTLDNVKYYTYGIHREDIKNSVESIMMNTNEVLEIHKNIINRLVVLFIRYLNYNGLV